MQRPVLPIVVGTVLLIAGAVVPLSHALAADRIAVFEFELIDTSLEGEVDGPRADQQRRLVALGGQLRQALAGRRDTTVIDIAPAASDIAAAAPLNRCGDCVADIAAPLGADLAVLGTVQKVSNLILNINVYLWDAKSRSERYRASVDIRGNTDTSWSRGLSYLIRNRLMPALDKFAVR